MSDLLMNRRSAITSLLAISTAGALAACGQSSADGRATKPVTDLSFASEGQFFSVSEMAFITALAQTIMPQTDTAGAIEAGVPETLQDLASNWATDPVRQYWREGIADMNVHFKKTGGRDFADLVTTVRKGQLRRFDADVFDGKISHQFYRDIKSTVIQAYYNSEPGASEELAYEPVPGEWIGCVPLSDFPKAWAT